MKTEKLHSVGTVPKSNWKIVERGNYFVLLLEDGTLISIIILPVIFFIIIFLYRKSLQIAKQLGDKALEAQACYSLGNTYTLLRDYEKAIEYHLRHLEIARQLEDRVGEGRACWSLGNAHKALGHHEEALPYANTHLKISREVRCSVELRKQDSNSNDDSAYPNNNVTNVSEPVPTPAKKSKWPKNFKHQNITVQIMHSKQQQIEILFHMLYKKKKKHIQKLDM